MQTHRRSLAARALLASLLVSTSAVPTGANDETLADPMFDDHEAPALEATLPAAVLRPEFGTFSLIGEAASDDWDEGYLLNYILATTCREIDHFEVAVLVDGRSVRALRFAGAEPERLREGYLGARRFVGPQTEPFAGPYGGFAATTDWRPAEESLGDREAILYHGEHGDFYTYFSGDTVYEVEAYWGDADHIVGLLPAPAGDPSLPQPPEPAPLDCPGADPELLELLPTTFGGEALEPYPLPPGFAARWHRELPGTTDDPDSISGYLLGLTVGSMIAAFHAPGAEAADLEAACLEMLYLHESEVKVADWAGRRVLTDRDRDSACHVRGDMLFAIRAPGQAKRFIRSIPLPEPSVNEAGGEALPDASTTP